MRISISAKRRGGSVAASAEKRARHGSINVINHGENQHIVKRKHIWQQRMAAASAWRMWRQCGGIIMARKRRNGAQHQHGGERRRGSVTAWRRNIIMAAIARSKRKQASSEIAAYGGVADIASNIGMAAAKRQRKHKWRHHIVT